MSKIYKYGIDISEHNGNIDLKNYKNHFVIIRGGYSTTVDKKAKRNMDLCEKLGIPYGVYWYSYALTTEKAKKEAKKCLEVIKGRDIKVGVWFDMEDADGWKKRNGFPSNKMISAMCETFCDIMHDKGYYTGIYASQSWFGGKIKTSYPKWVANWGSDNGKLNTITAKLGPMQQYTSRPLDKDVIYVPLSTFSSKAKKTTNYPTSKTKKSVAQIAKEVIAGKWGNGETRKERLKDAGYSYSVVQKEVNKQLTSQVKKKSVSQIAKEVINGKWGDGETRKKRLTKAGYSYSAVQKEVNKLLK